MSRSNQVYAALLHQPPPVSWLAAARARDQRLASVGAATGIAGLLDPGSLVVFPLGLLQATTLALAEAGAEEVARIAAQAQVAAVFGVDVLVSEPDVIGPTVVPYVFVCDGEERLLWSARQVRPTRRGGVAGASAASRCIRRRGQRLAVIAGSEVFIPGLRRELEAEKPELIVVLTHAGPTARWRAALDALARVAPVLVAGELVDGGSGTPILPQWARAPDGWCASIVSRQPRWTLQLFRRVERAVVGVPLPRRELELRAAP